MSARWPRHSEMGRCRDGVASHTMMLRSAHALATARTQTGSKRIDIADGTRPTPSTSCIGSPSNGSENFSVSASAHMDQSYHESNTSARAQHAAPPAGVLGRDVRADGTSGGARALKLPAISSKVALWFRIPYASLESVAISVDAPTDCSSCEFLRSLREGEG